MKITFFHQLFAAANEKSKKKRREKWFCFLDMSTWRRKGN